MASPDVAAPADNSDEVSLLDWLRVVADQNVPEVFQSAAVPVAWLGRTSTDDAQDPTLSLPRQLESSRRALPDGFVIVAKFYDVESGRTAMENRGMGTAHEQFDIPIPRDGGIARSEEHTSELQSREQLVCRLLLEKKKNKLCKNRYGKNRRNQQLGR